MNQTINRALAFTFIWVFGLGVATFLIFQIDKADFSYLVTEERLYSVK